jgi:hypothetical protein
MADSPPRAAAPPRWLYPALFVVFAAVAVPYTHKALDHRSAFVRWQTQVAQLGDGVDIAAVHNYPNPPVMALSLYPLARLPDAAGRLGISHDAALTAAALLLYFLKAGLTLLVFRWVFDMVAEPGRPFPAWACVLAAALSLRPILSDLQHGNINLIILFLVVASLAAFVRGRDFRSGLLMGLAVACKVTPALFLPYFLWKRAWRALAGCAAGLVLFLWPGLVPAAFLGWDYNQQLVRSWYGVMVRPYVLEGRVTSEHNNQSLPGLVSRLLTHSPSFSTYDDDDHYVPTRYDNLLDLDPRLARGVVAACGVAFVLLAAWACRTPASRRRGWRGAAEFGVVLLGMLLFSERTWKHHCVTLVVPFAVLCYHLASCRPGRGTRAFLVATLATATLLIATTSSGVEDRAPGRGISELLSKQAQVYGAFVLADLVLLGALAFLLRRGRDAEEVSAMPVAGKTTPVPAAQAGAA